jgi:cyanophycinase
LPEADKKCFKQFNFFETGILKRIISESKHKENSRIEVITTSNIPKEIGPEYVKAFEYLNAMNVGVLYIEKTRKAADEVVLERLREADIVMFTGGDQSPFLVELLFTIF